ncbi:hypothetical protein CNECB9_1820008 [Cupriavidus necator]|uniref:Uncharacterized protein n=1 Tax=Cupriavidus necator TaxID=106590 RepID=A0A1K0ICE2_CUPNE|nr:hypothetical protein CNECB9_1820008 [Cupriavidus necator]
MSPVVLTTGAHTAPVVEQDLCNLDFMVCKGAPTLPCYVNPGEPDTRTCADLYPEESSWSGLPICSRCSS